MLVQLAIGGDSFRYLALAAIACFTIFSFFCDNIMFLLFLLRGFTESITEKFMPM